MTHLSSAMPLGLRSMEGLGIDLPGLGLDLQRKIFKSGSVEVQLILWFEETKLIVELGVFKRAIENFAIPPEFAD